MKWVDEYRDPAAVRRLLETLEEVTTRPWTVMEICGGQTQSLSDPGILFSAPVQIIAHHGRQHHGVADPVRCVVLTAQGFGNAMDRRNIRVAESNPGQ